MTERIGILAGWEKSFPQAFIDRCNKVPGISAEFAKIGGTPERFVSPYRVLVDRISQEVKHYRFHLKAAALGGAYVINDPFWWSADDKFFGYSLASRIGVPLVSIDLASVVSSFLGTSGRNIRVAFDYAKSGQCVLLLDEFDALAKRRDDDTDIGELKRIVNVVLLELDRWPDTSLLVAATNHPQLLDPAVGRRFD